VFPVGHLGISLAVGRPLRLNLLVVAFAVLLPDLVDKPLYYFGDVPGRLVAHNLPFVFGVAVLFGLFNRWRGLSALVGGLLHLGQDAAGFIPWFYPFKSYICPLKPFEVLKAYLSIFGLGADMVGLGLLSYLAYAHRATLAKWARRWQRLRPP